MKYFEEMSKLLRNSFYNLKNLSESHRNFPESHVNCEQLLSHFKASHILSSHNTLLLQTVFHHQKTNVLIGFYVTSVMLKASSVSKSL